MFSFGDYNWIAFFTLEWEDGFQPDNACGMLRENTAASETALNCRQSEKRKGQFRLWISKPVTWMWGHHRKRDKSILLREVGTHLCAGFFCCPKAGYNWMTGWMGYDFAKTSCVSRESETTLRWDSGAGTEKRHSGRPAKHPRKGQRRRLIP